MTDRSGATSRSTSQGPQDGPSITLADAQANADALAQQLVAGNTLTPAERSNLVHDLKAALARVDAIEAQR